MAPSLTLRVPAKLTLFGEWAVLHDYPGIATALNKNFVLKLHKGTHMNGLLLKSPSDDSIEFIWNSPEHPVSGFFEPAIQLISLFTDSSTPQQSTQSPQLPVHLQGMTLELDRQWPLSEGLGSSSALTAALGLMLSKANDLLPLSLQKLFETLIPMLRKIQAGKGSGLDLAAQLYGGTVKLCQNSIQTLELQKPSELWVVHTGQKTSTTQAIQNIQKNTPHYLRAVENIAASTQDFIESGDWLKAIEQHQHALKDLGVIPGFVQNFANQALNCGWIEGYKTIGAGGGDALLLWVNPESIAALKTDLTQRGWWINTASWNAPGAQLL